jgi:hypothetical protein
LIKDLILLQRAKTLLLNHTKEEGFFNAQKEPITKPTNIPKMKLIIMDDYTKIEVLAHQ